jgi:tRNA A37 N6-isopentenylltransferase MiaA
VAVVAIGGVYVLLRPLLSAYNTPAPYQNAFRTEIEKQVLPALKTESQALLKAVGPDILKAIQQNTSRRLPEITAKLEQEGQALVQELSAEAKQRLSARSEKILARLETSLVKEIPQAADPQKGELILANGSKAAQGALDRFLQTYLNDHLDTVTNLQSRIEKFPVPQHIQKMSDVELRECLTETLRAYAMRQMSAARSPQMKEFLHSLKPSQTK